MKLDPVRQKAINGILEAANNWENSWFNKENKEMMEIHKEDAKDLRNIASLLKHMEDEKAAKAAWKLDTIVREELPFESWPFLGIRPLHY